MAGDRLISAAEAAERLGVSRATLYAYVSRGLMRAKPDPGDPRRSLYGASEVARLAKDKGRGRKAEEIAGAALDWGAPALASRITLIEDGRLFYRGRDAVQLASQASLEEAARLLWQCAPDDPFAGAAAPFTAAASPSASASHPVDACLAMLARQGASTGMTWRREARHLWPPAAALLRLMTAAACDTSASAAPIHETVAQAFGLDARGADIVRAALILCADHELNASAFAVRVVASTGAPLTACLIGGLAALSGPLHGGMTSLVELMFREADQMGDGARLVEERLRRGDMLPGFGHVLYPDGDPRARALLAMLPPDPARASLIAAMENVDRGHPNIDFALVSATRALGLRPLVALSLFTIGRSVGWIAHALEQQGEGKLIRPRARYVGEPPQI